MLTSVLSIARRRQPSQIYQRSNMRWFSSSTVDDDDDDSEGGLGDLLVETLPTEGEWAQCTRKFLHPLQVPVRGSGKHISCLLQYTMQHAHTYYF